jgi:16S rRNA processing protein RimM
MTVDTGELITLGKINGVYGLKGWVKVFSHTNPKGRIVGYTYWLLKTGNEWRRIEVLKGREHGKTVVAQLAGIDDRNQAEALRGAEIAVQRSQLEELDSDEYYWFDLVGLRVMNQDDLELGKVDHLFETGSNDVMVVKGDRERLVPFIQGQYVKNVDLKAGVIRVDWDSEF